VCGPIQVTGALTAIDSREIVVLVHGLGGSVGSHYIIDVAHRLVEAGCSVLRLNLRGSDLRGDGIYHAGLTADLEAAIESPELASYERLYVLGLSLGGHVALWESVRARNRRLRAVAAVCSPLDLFASSAALDRPRVWLYRRYVLASLQRIYAPVARRPLAPLPLAQALEIRGMREWDERIVAPYHGFRGADDYYTQASVGPRLDALERPSLLINSKVDPMIPEATIRPSLSKHTSRLEVRWVEGGGHVVLPRDLQLGFATERGFTAQVLGWFRSQ
jgi:predicted alpha/beta-fold hydrolase